MFTQLVICVNVLATIEERLKIYEEVASRFPKAYAPKRLPLEFLTG